MSFETKITVDSLIEENLSCLEALPEEAKYSNLNYSLRYIMTYLIPQYDQLIDARYACDHLAKIIAQLENEAL